MLWLLRLSVKPDVNITINNLQQYDLWIIIYDHKKKKKKKRVSIGTWSTVICAHLGRISHPAHSTEPMEKNRQLSSFIEFSSVSFPGMAGRGLSHSDGATLKTVPQRSSVSRYTVVRPSRVQQVLCIRINVYVSMYACSVVRAGKVGKTSRGNYVHWKSRNVPPKSVNPTKLF